MPTLLMTRPEESSQRFAARMGAVPVVISPLIGISFVEKAPEVRDGEHYVLTSAHAVAAISALGLPKRPAWCVGAATARAAEAAGLPARSADGDADALVAAIVHSEETAPLLHLHGAYTRGDVAGRLSAAGLTTRGAVAYLQPEQALSDVAQALTGCAVVPVFSPRTARIFAENWHGRARLYLVALSEAVAEPLRQIVAEEICVTARPDAEAMLEATEAAWARASRLEAGQGAAID
jgi:uroporphyrinogen-III synthase